MWMPEVTLIGPSLQEKNAGLRCDDSSPWDLRTASASW